ncbi:MAG: DUF554 family protein [Christensenellales bacterium]|jgi:uncharacterized membrane protein YqgA involved in biofilm formation
MPKGIIINSLSIFIGGLLGLPLKKLVSEDLKKIFITILGFGAFVIAIPSIIKLDSIPIVVLSLILGTVTGELIRLDTRLRNSLATLLNKTAIGKDKVKENHLITLITIFCFSGAGLFGVFSEGFTGDSSVLIAKSVLDFATALIFSSSIGFMASLIAAPQFIIFIILYLLSSYLGHRISDAAVSNFISIGGVITLMIGFNLTGIKEMRVLNAIPSFVYVILFTELLPV